MASYLELAKLMDEKDEQTEKLANELTVKDMIDILNNSKSTPIEIEVVAKAAELIAEAEQKYVQRINTPQSNQESNFNLTDMLSDILGKLSEEK